MGETATGPDRINAEILKAVDIEKLSFHFNLWIQGEHLPETLLLGRTVFIPKELGSNDPLKHRPLIARCLYTIPAKRIEECDKDPRQKGSGKVTE